MKKINILFALLLMSVFAYGQIDTLDLSITDFGLPSRPGEADFMRNEAYKANLGIVALNNMTSPSVTLMSDTITLDATKIVGTDAGDIGHADGAILVTAPGTGYAMEFVSAYLIYDYSTAAYTGGADDAVIQVGVTGTQVAVTSAITGASLLEASADAILRLGSTATELVYADNGAISLYGTALTNPGTAAGVLRVHITYKIHTTGL